VLSGHGRRHEGRRSISEGFVRANNRRGRVAFILIGRVQVLGWVCVVVLIRVAGQRAQPDGNARGLKVGRIEGDDADNIVVVGL
jgi:hypothetical protein